MLLVDALYQGLDVQLFWSDAVYRRNDSAQNVVLPLIFSRLFDGDRVPRIGDDANRAAVSVGIAADFANWFGGEVKANFAESYLLLRINQSLGKCLDFTIRTLEDVQGKPLGSFRSYSGEALQLFDEAGEGGRINGEFDSISRTLSL